MPMVALVKHNTATTIHLAHQSLERVPLIEDDIKQPEMQEK